MSYLAMKEDMENIDWEAAEKRFKRMGNRYYEKKSVNLYEGNRNMYDYQRYLRLSNGIVQEAIRCVKKMKLENECLFDSYHPGDKMIK